MSFIYKFNEFCKKGYTNPEVITLKINNIKEQ